LTVVTVGCVRLLHSAWSAPDQPAGRPREPSMFSQCGPRYAPSGHRGRRHQATGPPPLPSAVHASKPGTTAGHLARAVAAERNHAAAGGRHRRVERARQMASTRVKAKDYGSEPIRPTCPSWPAITSRRRQEQAAPLPEPQPGQLGLLMATTCPDRGRPDDRRAHLSSVSRWSESSTRWCVPPRGDSMSIDYAGGPGWGRACCGATSTTLSPKSPDRSPSSPGFARVPLSPGRAGPGDIPPARRPHLVHRRGPPPHRRAGRDQSHGRRIRPRHLAARAFQLVGELRPVGHERCS
jgi:hypothetical protein